MRKLHFFSDYLRARYGRPLQRIPIDLALGCPNRAGGYGPGCIFCAENGSRARHLARDLKLPEQVAAGIEYNRRRYGAEAPYIAYFQSFTSTFAPVDVLRRLYLEALSAAEFKVVIIGTRPDALPADVIDLLRELAEAYEVWVELGVQTANDRTLELIRRGHDFAAVGRAAAALEQAGIAAAAHVILGLPGETGEDYLHTARELAKLPFRAVKLHQLQVLKKTELAARCAGGGDLAALRPLNEYEYAAAAAGFLRELPEDWLIMRLMADAEDSDIVAPRWWMSKGQFLDFFREKFESGAAENDFSGVVTADGSRTMYHPEFRQHFHSLAGAESEAQYKFIAPARLEERLRNAPRVRLLDLGFGLGVNAIAAWKTAEAVGHGKLEIVSLELDLRTVKAARGLHAADTLEYRILTELLDSGVYHSPFAELRLVAGDARATLPGLPGTFDLVFLDAFSPDCNPELWTLDFLREVANRLDPAGLLLSYSSAHPFRGALLKLGLEVGESLPFGRKRGGTAAACRSDLLPAPLPAKERDIIRKSTAGVPYRDRGLQHSREAIFACRQKLVEKLRGRGVPKWHKPDRRETESRAD